MADDDELELDTEKKKSGGKGKIIMIIAVVVLLTTGSLVGGLYFTGNLGGGASSKHADDAEGKSDSHDAEDAKDAKDAKELVVKPAFYYSLQPAFVVNFEEKTQAAYLQIEMQLMVSDKTVNDQITKHMPFIRNNILLILSSQKYEEVRTRQGKEKLQGEVLDAVRAIVGGAMKEELEKESETKIDDKDVPNVEQVYFTSFIMQ